MRLGQGAGAENSKGAPGPLFRICKMLSSLRTATSRCAIRHRPPHEGPWPALRLLVALIGALCAERATSRGAIVSLGTTYRPVLTKESIVAFYQRHKPGKVKEVDDEWVKADNADLKKTLGGYYGKYGDEPVLLLRAVQATNTTAAVHEQFDASEQWFPRYEQPRNPPFKFGEFVYPSNGALLKMVLGREVSPPKCIGATTVH